MIHSLLDDEKKEAICKAIGTILYNTNRSIYNWNKRAADSKTYTYGPTEIRSLVHGNITRELRFILGETVVRRMFKAGKIFIHMEPSNGYISELVMPQLPSWMSESFQHEFVRFALKMTDYKLFYYDPSADMAVSQASYTTSDFSPKINLDLTSLEKFTF